MTDSRQMDRIAYAWLQKTAINNLWRVSSWCELDDLIQDGAMIYARVRARYPHATERPHIMRLFQVSYINHLHTMARKTGRAKEAVANLATIPQAETDADVFSMSLLLAHAPEPVLAILRLYTTAEGRRRLRSEYRVRRDGQRETMNERLAYLIGIDANGQPPDLAGMIRRYFAVV